MSNARIDSRAIPLFYATALLHGLVNVGFVTISSFLRLPLGMSDLGYGMIYVPFFAASGMANWLAPRARRTWGMRGTFALGTFAAALAYALLMLEWSLAPSAGRPLLYLIAALLGGGTGLGGVVLNAGVLEQGSSGKSTGVVLLHGTLGVGACLAPAFAVLLRDLASPLAFPLLACALLVTVATLGGRWLPAAGGEEISELHLGRHRVLIGFAAAAFLYGLSEATFSNWAVVYLTGAVGLERVPAARALSFFWAGITLGRLVLARLLDRKGAVPTSIALAFAMAVSFCLLPFVRDARGALWAYAAAGLACSGLFPLLLDLAARRVKGEATLCSSVLGIGLLIGLALGSAGISPFVERQGWRPVFLASAIGPILLAATLGLLAAQRGGAAKGTASSRSSLLGKSTVE